MIERICSDIQWSNWPKEHMKSSNFHLQKFMKIYKNYQSIFVQSNKLARFSIFHTSEVLGNYMTSSVLYLTVKRFLLCSSRTNITIFHLGLYTNIVLFSMANIATYHWKREEAWSWCLQERKNCSDGKIQHSWIFKSKKLTRFKVHLHEIDSQFL